MSPISLLTQLFLLAFFLSVNNFAASIGMGFSRIWTRARWKIAVLFGLFDFLAPIGGLYIGNLAADVWGKAIGAIGVFAIFSLGAYLVYDGWTKHGNESSQEKNRVHNFADRAMASTWSVVIIALGISLDNFIVGFGLGALQIPIIVAAIVFGSVTFLMTVLGIYIGSKIRKGTEEKIINFAGKGRIITGAVFIIIALWKLFEIL